MNIKNITSAITVTAAAVTVATLPLQAATPEVTSVTMTQPGPTRFVNITYTIANAPAVITLDVQTNANTSAAADDPGWTSIGGEAVCNATGDVWKKVGTSGTFNGTIAWRPDLSWPDHIIADGGARAVVTAWALDNTPNYMVVDISEGAQQNTQKYYTSTNHIPGGLFGRDEYRTTKLVMRKIMAKDVEWTMGSTTLEPGRNAAREKSHPAILTNNYYIGVFEITQTQWDLIQTARPAPSYFSNKEYRRMRPVENVSYNEIRNNDGTSVSANTTYDWPHDPNPDSFLGLLYRRTGIKFDLPTDAQWEFAARAGNGDQRWGDGSAILGSNTDSNMNRLGRNQTNGGGKSGAEKAANSDATEGTAIVGSYAPNNWGLYDMHGNVMEWCLDWYEDDVSAYEGKLNINPANSQQLRSGNTPANGRVNRGGSCLYAAPNCRSANRFPYAANTRKDSYNYHGFRVVCTAGLQ